MDYKDLWVLVYGAASGEAHVVPESSMLELLMDSELSGHGPLISADRWGGTINGYVTLTENLNKGRIHLDPFQENLKYLCGYLPDREEFVEDTEVYTLVKARILDPSRLTRVFDLEGHRVTGLPATPVTPQSSEHPIRHRRAWEL